MKTESKMTDELVETLSAVKWTNIIDSLTPTSTFTIDPRLDVFSDIFMEAGYEDFVDLLRNAIYTVMEQKYNDIDVPSTFADIKIKLEQDKILMHNISAKHENTVVSFECVILASDVAKTYIKECKLVCPKCGYGFSVTCDHNRNIPFEKCVNPTCREAKLMPDQDTLVTENIQTVFLNEPLEEAIMNSPKMFVGKIKGTNVGTAFVGQKKRVIGLFKTVYDPKKTEHDVIIDISYIEDLDDVKLVNPSDSELKKLKEDSKEPDFINKVVSSYAPHIYGYGQIKKSLLLQLAGGVNGKRRGDINSIDIRTWG